MSSMIKLLLHTLSTSTTVSGDCIVYWQNPPKLPNGSKSVLIDATPLSPDEIYPLLQDHASIVLLGPDLLIALKVVTPYQLLTFVRAISHKEVTVILNSDDALRSGEHEVLLTSLAHAADSVTALRELPSGRDKEYAGMARFTRGYACKLQDRQHEGERLYKYKENMMAATLHS